VRLGILTDVHGDRIALEAVPVSRPVTGDPRAAMFRRQRP
jgi:hypothetical protein